MIFANSMSDLFHKRIPRAFIDQVFDTMERADWHIYQVLTKRSSLMQHYIARRYGSRPVPRHIWLGVSVEMRCGPSGLRICGHQLMRGIHAPTRLSPLSHCWGR